ncbi:MAG: GNAT family N-acetyltransferase [Acidobacteriota bacterium]
MKWFLGDDYAQIRFSESTRSFSVDIVMVPAAHRGQGIGTTLIQHIIHLADCMGKDVYLSARPIGSFSAEKLDRLVAYYRRLGFEVIDTGLTVSHMRREPAARPG